MSAFQEKRISTSVLMEMGHVSISGKVNFHVCFGGNGECKKTLMVNFHVFCDHGPDFRKVNFHVCFG